MSRMKTIRIGCGAGYAGDRVEPAIELAEHGRLDYLVFECLAERTIALAQQARAADPETGFDPLLVERMRAVLPICATHAVRIVTNMGAANPPAAAAAVCRLARQLGLHGLTVATVTGDDVLDLIRAATFQVSETGEPVDRLGASLVSANAYLGADAIVTSLQMGADVVITGRVADPSLFLAPQIHEFGWATDAWQLLGAGTVAGHLIECAGQVTGGYFADPGYKDVTGLARLGFPIAEISEYGTCVITKVEGSGGAVTTATCKEQLVYEIHDPRAYVTPDVVVDLSGVRITSGGADRVLVEGADGWPRPDALKVSLGCRDGFVGEGQISYAGPGAVARARLASAIVAERLQLTGVGVQDIRHDLIGVDALHGARSVSSRNTCDPYEVRLRVAGRTPTHADAVRIGNEVEALYTNGPAGGGGVTRSTREVLSLYSTLVPRNRVDTSVHCETV